MKADVYERIAGRIVTELEKGSPPLVQAVERRTCRGADYAASAIQRNPVPGNQCADALVRSHDEGLFRPDLADVQAIPRIKRPCEEGRERAALSFTPQEPRAPKLTATAARESERRYFPSMKGYTVFNVEAGRRLARAVLCEGQDPGLTPCQRIDRAESFFLHATGATIRHGGDRAFYTMARGPGSTDAAVRESFQDAESYYAARWPI